jgi:outer membrane protein TolC
MKKIKILVFVGVLCAPFYPLCARNLSVDESTELVMAESQDVKKAEANIKKMQAVLDGVNANRWVKVDGVVAYQKNAFGLPINNSLPAVIDNVGTVGVNASMPIYTFGKIGYAVDMAKQSLKIAEKSSDLAKIEMRASAIQMYWSAKMADEMVGIAEKSLKNTKNAARNLTAAGRANRSNLVKITADVAAREIDLDDAKYNRDAAFRMLKAYAGIDDGESIVLTSKFPDKFNDIKEKEISPVEWDIYNLQAKIYDSEKWKNYAGYLPTLAATGSYDYLTVSDSANNLFDNATRTSSVGISLSVPLFDAGAKRAAATSSAMSAISAREDLDKSRKLKTAEYKNLVQKYEHLQEQLKNLFGAKDLAEKAYKLSRDKFLVGQTSATELSDVERAFVQTDASILNTKLQILTAAENIKKYEK